MYDKVYDIDYKRLVRWKTPERKRLAVLLTWLYALVQPVISAHQSFLLFRKSRIYQLTITPQICYLERLLNDRFDNDDRRIYIEDTDWFDPWYVYQEDELKPRYMYTEAEDQPVYTYTDAEAGETPDDFIVFVPASLVFDNTEMRALLNINKLPGTHYNIQTF
jgi:hypothetical protein